MNKTGKEIFGSVLLGEDEYTVLPKSTTEISKKIPLDAEYVGFAVLFRKPLGTQWKLLIKAEEAKGRKILIAECSVRDVSDSEDWHIEEIKHQIELKNSCML